MTLDELQTAVVENTNRSDKLSVVTRAVNSCLKELQQFHNWRALCTETDLSISAGDSNIALPEDFYQLSTVRVTDAANSSLSQELEIRPKRDLIRLYPNLMANTQGRPRYGFEDNAVLFFFPPSSQDYVLRVTYDKVHPELVNSDDSTVTTEIDSAIVAFATAEVLRSIQMFQDSQVWMTEYGRRRGEAKMADKRKPAEVRKMRGVDNPVGDGKPSSGDPYENRYTRT